MQSLIGTGVALVTPFKKDFSVDIEALQRIVNFSIDGGVEYLVVMGTTAENATLTQAEKELVIKTVIDTNKGRLPLVLGVGGNNTMQIVEELKQMIDPIFASSKLLKLFVQVQTLNQTLWHLIHLILLTNLR